MFNYCGTFIRYNHINTVIVQTNNPRITLKCLIQQIIHNFLNVDRKRIKKNYQK